MKSILLLIVFICISVIGWIRFSPSDKDRWHVDPAEADYSQETGFRLIGPEAPRFPSSATNILEEFSDIATSEVRVKRLDGDISEGMITFMAWSKYVGFRDYITVKAVAEGTETKLAVISRAHFSVGSDWGLNRERLNRWLAELERRVSR